MSICERCGWQAVRVAATITPGMARAAVGVGSKVESSESRTIAGRMASVRAVGETLRPAICSEDWVDMDCCP